jgi:hypothetical protein
MKKRLMIIFTFVLFFLYGCNSNFSQSSSLPTTTSQTTESVPTSTTSSTIITTVSDNETFTIRFLLTDDTEVAVYNLEAGDLIVPPQNPTMLENNDLAFSFIGWVGYSEGMRVEQDVTFYAEFITYSAGLIFTLSDDETYYIVEASPHIENYTTITIPSIYNGFPVTEIADHGFQPMKYLKTLNMPDTIEVIGNYAFFGDYE